MQETIDILKNDNTKMLENFTKLYNKYPNSVQEYINNAHQVDDISNNFYQYIDSLKNLLSLNKDFNEIRNPFAKHESRKLFLANYAGIELAIRIEYINNKYYQIAKQKEIRYPDYIKDLRLINIDNKKDWTSNKFKNLSKIETILFLMKIEKDINIIHNKLLNTIIRCIGAQDFRFERIIPIINFDKNIVFQNETTYTSILLGNYSSKIKSYLNMEDCLEFYEDEKYSIILPTHNKGINTKKGKIIYWDLKNERIESQISIDYLVY